MPSTPEANGRTATNAPLLAGILACVGFCEFVGARPTDAKVAAFAFGRARGVIETCAGALGSDRVLDPADMEATRGHSARRREQGSGQDARDRPLAVPRRSLCPQARCRPRRSMPDRVRWSHAGGAPWLTTSKLPSPPAPSSRFEGEPHVRQSSRGSERSSPTRRQACPSRTGEAALADRLANAWAGLAQEMEDAL